MPPPIKYARSGDLYIAYQVVGEGSVDLVLAPGYPSHPTLDTWQDEPVVRRAIERLAESFRLILMDVRGFGLSDRRALPTMEAATDDLITVLDEVGSERPGVFAASSAGLFAMVSAATNPERVGGLVLFGAYAATMWSEGYPWGTKPEQRAAEVDQIVELWGTGADVDLVAPSAAADDHFREWWARRQRSLAPPSALPPLFEMLATTDVRDVLHTIRVPTLVIHRTDDPIVPVENGRYLAEHIPNAKYVELPGSDHMPFTGDWEAVVDEVEEFLTGTRRPRDINRVLATVLFTDVCNSTQRAAQLGDRRWREVLDRHDTMVERYLKEFGGRMIKTTGDGLLATFDGPARAIRCAAEIRQAARNLDLDIRAGLHAGEVEVRGRDLGGIAVHIGARIADLAAPGEVLVSSTVRDLVAGSGIEFVDRGLHRLRGVPDDWRLFAVANTS